jgi:hypothetical protein
MGVDMAVAERLCKSDEVLEQCVLCAELEAQGALEMSVSREIFAQHDTPRLLPPQQQS